MKKKEVKKQLKTQEKHLKKSEAVIKSYKKMIEEYEDIAKRMKKSLKRFENLLNEIDVDERFTEEELNQLLGELETQVEPSEKEED